MKIGYVTLYEREGSEVPREMVAICVKDGITFHPELRNAILEAGFPSIVTDYIQAR